MDKATYEALRAILVPYFRAGGSYANAVEAVRMAEAAVEEQRRTEEAKPDAAQ